MSEIEPHAGSESPPLKTRTRPAKPGYFRLNLFINLDVTSFFRAEGSVSLGRIRKDRKNERQTIYDGREDTDIAGDGCMNCRRRIRVTGECGNSQRPPQLWTRMAGEIQQSVYFSDTHSFRTCSNQVKTNFDIRRSHCLVPVTRSVISFSDRFAQLFQAEATQRASAEALSQAVSKARYLAALRKPCSLLESTSNSNSSAASAFLTLQNSTSENGE